MSEPDVRVLLDRDPPVFAPGEPITGTVEVESREEVDAKRIWVRRAYRAEGERSLDIGATETVELEGARTLLEPGRVYRYGFELPAPEGPATYDGRILELGWAVQAVVELPGISAAKNASDRAVLTLEDPISRSAAGSPEAEPEIRVVRLADLPPDEARAVAAMPVVEREIGDEPLARLLRWRREHPRLGCGAIVAALGCFGMPLLLAMAVPAIAALQMLGRGQWLLGGTILLVALLIYSILLRMSDRALGGVIGPALTRARFGGVALKAQVGELRRGGTVSWFVQLDPRRDLTVRQATATLELEEVIHVQRSTEGGGVRVTEVPDRRSATLEQPVAAARGETTLVAGRLPLPVDWPASLYGRSQLRWNLRVGLDLAGGPDFSRQIPLDVR